MNKMIFGFLILAVFLASCSNAPAAVPQTQTSEVSETSEVLPAPTETRVPPTATATPIPTYSIEQLTAMSSADKLAMAPQVGTAPADVVASFLPKGADVANITWGEKTLTYWERVVAYHGKAGGKEVTLYYDLESGQWAKKYQSFESLSQIPASQVPDVMVLGLGGELGDRLIRNKLQYNYDWISQPQAVTADGKQIFRDEKGYPKAVFDTASQKWLTPEQADVVYTLEKWKEIHKDKTYVGYGEKTYSYDVFNNSKMEMITDPERIRGLENGTFMLILNPSGEVMIWDGQEDGAMRVEEGAVAFIGAGSDRNSRNSNFNFGILSDEYNMASDQYKAGNKTIFLTYNDVGHKRMEIEGIYSPYYPIIFENFPILLENKDQKTGKIFSPILRMPKHFSYFVNSEKFTQITDPDFWLNEVIEKGGDRIIAYNVDL